MADRLKVITKSKRYPKDEAYFDLEKGKDDAVLFYAQGSNWAKPGSRAYSIRKDDDNSSYVFRDHFTGETFTIGYVEAEMFAVLLDIVEDEEHYYMLAEPRAKRRRQSIKQKKKKR